MPNYGEFNYWENRYLDHKEITFDWLEDFESLRDIFKNLFKDENYNQNSSILMLGCGNSELSEKIYEEMGIKNISNIDISSNVIKSMKERFKDNKPEMKWDVMDVRDLKFSSNHFDIVIDKALMDTIMCGENSFCSVALMTKEVQRVLKTGGIYVIVSYGDPEIRLPHLNREHLSFNISYQIIRKNFQFDPKDDDEGFFPNNPIEKTNFVYICKKKVGADSVCQENYPTVFYELDKQETIQEEDFMESEDENK